MKDRFEVFDRELDAREFDGIHVRLMWVPDSAVTYVNVTDTKQMDHFQVEVPDPSRAREVFMHPFSFRAEQLGVVEPEDEEDGRGTE